MGLDQKAYSMMTHGKESPAVVDTDNVDDHVEETDLEILQTWRKHPDLQDWMEDLWKERGGAGEFNIGQHVQVTVEDLDRLEITMKSGLPKSKGGFFWGQSQYPEDHDLTMEFIEKARDAISRGLTVYYTSWW